MMVMCAACNLSFVVHEKYTDEDGKLHCPKCNEVIPEIKVKPFGAGKSGEKTDR